jgi:hypothetical protein
MKRYWFFKIIALVALAILALSTVVMLLWNWLVPAIFNGPTISFGQAAGLLILSRLLFGNFGQKRWSQDYLARKRNWRRKFEQKWQNMTPEERERFKANMKQRCSKWGWMPHEAKESKLEKV